MKTRSILKISLIVIWTYLYAFSLIAVSVELAEIASSANVVPCISPGTAEKALIFK